jgi:hypothetical protein
MPDRNPTRVVFGSYPVVLGNQALNFCPKFKSLFVGDSCIKNNCHLKSFSELGTEMFFFLLEKEP